MRTVTAILDTDQTKLCYVDSAGAFSPLGFLAYRGEWLDLRLTVKTANVAAVLSTASTYQFGAKPPTSLVPPIEWYYSDPYTPWLTVPILNATTKLWVTATAYEKYDILWHGTSGYRAKSAHTSDASTQPGTGADWQTVWETTTDHNPALGKLQFSVNCNTTWFERYLAQGTRTTITSGGIPRGQGKQIHSELVELTGGVENRALMSNGMIGILPDILGYEWATVYSPGVAHASGATTDPTVNDDSGDGYQVGSSWANRTAGRIWLCTDPTVGAAVWRLVGLTSLATTYAVDTVLTAPPGRSRILGDTAAGNVVLTLPAAADADPTAELQIIKGAAANSLVIRPDGSETINGSTGDATLTTIAEYVLLLPVTGGWLHLNPTYIRS